MKKIVVSVAISVLGIFMLSYFLWIAAPHQVVTLNPITGILETFKIINNQTVDWKIYNAPNNFLTFKYPVNLEKLMSGKQFSLSINSKQEIINKYKKFEDGGCPSICGRFVDDPSLLQKQFEILEKISTLPNCAFSITEKEDIKNNFILFSSGINNKYHIEGIKIKNNKCGLKIIESGGFDVSLSNIHYKVSMFINNKVINISFPMYPHSAFADVDNLWAKMDFDSVNFICGPVCIAKETEYFNKFNVAGSVEKQVVETYDQIIATLDFID